MNIKFSFKVSEKQTLAISLDLILDKKIILTLNWLRRKRYIIANNKTELKISVKAVTEKFNSANLSI
jgi:hypothetical protein